jgi:hypothetical protein
MQWIGRMTDKIYQSDQINELATALALAQGEMECASKDSANPFFKSKYAALPEIIKASRPYLSKHGLSTSQLTDFEGDKIFLITQLSHKSGQWMRSWYTVNPVKHDPQGIGSAVTYARRYSYSCITGVVASDEDDDGEQAQGRGKITQGANKKEFESIKKAIMESNDPAYTWGQNLQVINKFLEQDKQFYNDLVDTGKKRREELMQINMQKEQLTEYDK